MKHIPTLTVAAAKGVILRIIGLAERSGLPHSDGEQFDKELDVVSPNKASRSSREF